MFCILILFYLMSSFFKRVLGFGKSDDDSFKEDSSTKPETVLNYSIANTNTPKCKAIVAPYVEVKEEQLRLELLSLFDGNSLINEKVYQAFIEEVSKFKITPFKDISRHKESNKNGGIDFNNKETVSQIRSTGTEVIKQVGKKLLSGDFNLTTISFPIKVMIPISMVQACAFALFNIPYFMYQSQGKDVVERLKYTIVATISPFYSSGFSLKPLNPVLGETYEAMFSDGSNVFVEQSSHHPPVSHYEVYGINNSYYYAGYSQFSTSAGLNSLTVTNKGKRFMKFKDGVRFDFDFFNVSIIYY